MRSWALAVGSLFLTLCWPHSASTEDWPTRTVTVVVPLPAGTSVDRVGHAECGVSADRGAERVVRGAVMSRSRA